VVRVTLRVVRDDEESAEPIGVTTEPAEEGTAPSPRPAAGPPTSDPPGAEPPLRLRSVVSGRAHKRGLGRLTLRQKLVAVGATGVLLTLVVMQSALWGLGTVNREHRTVDLIRQAQRFHLDSDDEHEALHADVLTTFLVSAGQAPVSKAQSLASLAEDSEAFQNDIDKARALGLSASQGTPEHEARVGPVSKALESVRPDEERFLQAAQQLGQLAFTDRPAAQARLLPFEELVKELEAEYGRVTEQVAGVADAAEADARQEVRKAQQRIMAASGAALLGLIAMALMLDRVGRQLAEAATEVEAHVEAVVRSEQHSREFLAYAAHQLRTPINATRTSAEALLLQGASRAQEDRLSMLIRETGRAGRLITALLRMARLDQGEVPVVRPCDVVELCVQELERMAARAPALRWMLEAQGPVPERVPLSPDATAEVLANLVDNACRHAQSTVTVRVSMAGEALRIVVSDDGPGLPEGARVSAFERFVSLDGHGGSGLGLPIARGLAEAQGGRLDHEPDGFVVTLPVRRVEGLAA